MKVHVVTFELGYESGVVGIYSRQTATNNGIIQQERGERFWSWECGTGDRDDWQFAMVTYDVEVQR